MDASRNRNLCYGQDLRRSLAECLRDVVETRPSDPVDCMVQWLYKSADSRLYARQEQNLLQQAVNVGHELERLRRHRSERLSRIRSNMGILRDILGEDRKLKYDMDVTSMMDRFKRRQDRASREYYNLGPAKDLPARKPRVSRDLSSGGSVKRHDDLKDDDSQRNEFPSAEDGKAALFGANSPPEGHDQDVDLDLEGYGKNEGKEREEGSRMTPEELVAVKSVGSQTDGTVKDRAGQEETDGGAAETKEDKWGRLQELLKSSGLNRKTKTGLSTFGSLRTKKRHVSQDPVMWQEKKFLCQTLYDHEIYTICDPDADPVDYESLHIEKMDLLDFLGVQLQTSAME